MEETMSVQDIFTILKKRWSLLVLITLIAALLSTSISYLVLTPQYSAATQILVNQKNTENRLDLTQLSSNVELINTYSVIIKSPAILEKVIEKLSLTQSVKQLNQKITINSQENSQVFSLTVVDSDPSKAVDIANTISETFQKDISDIMSVDNVSILAKAELEQNPIPIKPKPFLNIAIAVVVGLIVGIALSFFLEYLDNTLKNGTDVETYLGLPVLGTIQKIPQGNRKRESKVQKIRGETFES